MSSLLNLPMREAASQLFNTTVLMTVSLSRQRCHARRLSWLGAVWLLTAGLTLLSNSEATPTTDKVLDAPQETGVQERMSQSDQHSTIRVAQINALNEVAEPIPYGLRENVRQFAQEVARRNQLDPMVIQRALDDAQYSTSVAKLIMPPASPRAKNWQSYRQRNVDPIRIKGGVSYWFAHEQWLRRAEERFGVPPEIIIGIIGVETVYGRVTGNFRLIDALTTLSFDFPTGRSDRSPFFRQELEQLFVMSARQKINPMDLQGSYAGAMGVPQFMPSSFNKYAIDFDNDGKIDLFNSQADVIGSVANYLVQFGWQRLLPTHFSALPPQNTVQKAQLLVPDILPTFSWNDLTKLGAQVQISGARSGATLNTKWALIELLNGDNEPDYVAGTQNFYVITRYNWSSFYALAVIELGEAVKQTKLRSTAFETRP
jgi:membrane-bound lytic murein transglycosylase B